MIKYLESIVKSIWAPRSLPRRSFPDIGKRVNGSDYLELPVGHRTVFVTAASDMMQYVSIFSDSRYAEQFRRAREYTRNLKSGELTEKFDNFLKEDESRLSQGAANCFCNALVAWSSP